MQTTRRSGLGRNLTALLGPSAPEAGHAVGGVRMVAREHLSPSQFQPRVTFDPASLQELAHSIQQQGVLQPLLVRELTSGHFEILAGERRFRACQLIGMTDIPVIVKVLSDLDAMTVALVDNLQREDLNILEQARGISRLIESCNLTHQQVSEMLGKSRSAVSNVLRLLQLPEVVQQYVERGQLEMGHARALLVLSLAEQLQAAEMVVAQQLSVRATEQLVSRMQRPTMQKLPLTLSDAMVAHQQSLRTALNARVDIQHSRGRRAGKVVIHFDSEKGLEALVNRLAIIDAEIAD